MRKTIDKLGRIQLPAKMREEVGLIGENCGVEIEVWDGAIVITNPKRKEEKEKVMSIISELESKADEHDKALLDTLRKLV